jgi:hypothetical protein
MSRSVSQEAPFRYLNHQWVVSGTSACSAACLWLPLPLPSPLCFHAAIAPSLNTDRWYYRVFQSAPDRIRALLPGRGAAVPQALGLDPDEPGDRLYQFADLELKELSHRLDGVLWPRRAPAAVKPVALSVRFCCSRCRCTRIQGFTTGCVLRAFGFCSVTRRWSTLRWW